MSARKRAGRAIDEASTLEEVATLVCSALDESEISVVLSGGAAVSIYSENWEGDWDKGIADEENEAHYFALADRFLQELGWAS